MTTKVPVATIPAGVTFDAALAAMRGMGGVYPPESLSLTSDVGGRMLILHDPDAATSGEPQSRFEVEVGRDGPGDLLAFAFSADDHQDGLLAFYQALIDMLETAGGANYLTFWVQPPNRGRYGITVQRSGGRTPAEDIAALDVARMVAEFHEHIGSPPWDGPVAEMPADTLRVRNALITEEVQELVTALAAATCDGDVVGIADALADIVYVAYGTAFTYRIPLTDVIAEVHRANMTKDAGPTGKAVKGDRYSPPDVAGILAGRVTGTPTR